MEYCYHLVKDKPLEELCRVTEFFSNHNCGVSFQSLVPYVINQLATFKEIEDLSMFINYFKGNISLKSPSIFRNNPVILQMNYLKELTFHLQRISKEKLELIEGLCSSK